MRESELKKLIVEEFLAFVDDLRVERTRRHPLETIVVVSLLAVISGADRFVSIELYATKKHDWLATFLDMSGGVPSHDTVGRVFSALNPKSLAEAFRRWTLAMTNASQDKLIAIDALAAVRGHWSIENELHWVLDVAFREDDCRVRAQNAAANFSAIRQHALALLKQGTETKIGIKNRRLSAGWDDSFLLKVIWLPESVIEMRLPWATWSPAATTNHTMPRLAGRRS